MRRFVLLLVLAAVMLPSVMGAELGVNYYMESMVSEQWKVPYIPRTLSEVEQDMDHIKTISSHIKFYMNPFVDENLPWVEGLVARSEARGFTSAVNMMVDDRQLDDGNWWDYRNRVLNACSRLSGDADIILVANEVSIHSPWDKYTARAKIEPLINDCNAVFAGEVTYEAFWYEKEAWYDYNKPLYFMQYEGFDSFAFNVNEMDERFGSNAYIGEWGEDILDGDWERTHTWQREQMELRWAEIEKTSTPVAYIYTYKEPSWNGFGIVYPDGRETPAWEFFASLGGGSPPVCEPSAEVCDGVDNDCDGATDEGDVCGGGDPDLGIEDLPVTCDAPGCSLISDVHSGVCRTVEYSTSNGNAKVQGCEKDGDWVELYRQNAPSGDWEICFANGCVGDHTGFVRFIPVVEDGDPVDPPDDPPVDPPGDDYTGIESLVPSCVANGQTCSVSSDVKSGVCRTVVFGTSWGDIKIQGCEKPDNYVELYKQSAPGVDFEACLGEGCVTDGNGFARWQPQTGGGDPPVDPPGDINGVRDLPVESRPAGSKLSDVTSGICRTVEYDTSSGYIRAKVCEKSDNYYEMYLQQGSGAQICVYDACVGWNAGYTSFTI